MRLIDADALTQKESVMRKGCAYIEEINNAPTIDAEPIKRGTWRYYAKGNDMWAVCSECEIVSIVGENYCPNCGAKMEGMEE